ncbi:MAG: carboxypeptidase-like regulatory domain-containing protein [Bacteroidetes bacterium]|nr:carboxypeptidase-like regulatory domain-containing protein [Bacteroidota bacterium]
MKKGIWISKGILILALIIGIHTKSYTQKYEGSIINKISKKPVEYVNIGVVGKNIGTVCNSKGIFEITLNSDFDNEILAFSCIGYQSITMKVKDFKALSSKIIYFTEKTVNLKQVEIKPKQFKQKTLGYTTQTKMAVAGFKENKLGYELGIMMDCKKSAIIEKVNFNIADCTYDSIFFRLNIYEVDKNDNYSNILKHPIYISFSKAQVKNKITVDLTKENIITNGDFLVSLEQVKDLGPGSLNFCCSLIGKTHYIETSQGKWDTVPVGISISVEAKVEK